MVKRVLTEHEKDLIEKIVQDNVSLHKEKDLMQPIYEQLSRYLKPMRSGWGFETETGEDFGKYIFDGEPIAAKNRLVDGIFGWLVNPSIPWLAMEPRGRANIENLKVQQHLSNVIAHLMSVFARSNFYDVISEAFDDGAVFGTVVVNVEESKKLGRPIYEALHLREVLVSENADGDVDLLHREFEMTYRQLFENFGEEAVEKDVLEAAKKNLERKVRVLHAVYPRYYPGEADNSVKIDINKPFASVYLFCGESLSGNTNQKPLYVLREGGYDFKHFEAWRFSHSAGMTYGYSPSMDALFDIKMINMQAKTMADVAQLAARPPMMAPMSMKGQLRIAPGGVSYYTGDNGVQPIITTINYPLGIDSLERRAKIIRDHYKNDYFMSISQNQSGSRQRTATEIMQVKAEDAAVMGSMIGRIQSELLEPLVDLTIRIETAAGRMPPLPEGLDPAMVVDLVFIGPLAQAQKKYLVKQGIEGGLQAAFGMAQANPDILMNINMNQAARDLMRVEGFPPNCLVDPAEVQKMQERAQKQRAAEAQRQAELEQAKATPAAGKAPEQGSPLANMMGQK